MTWSPLDIGILGGRVGGSPPIMGGGPEIAKPGGNLKYSSFVIVSIFDKKIGIILRLNKSNFHTKKLWY